jgi:polyhydroxyalkanoate synthesis regulator phasin
VRGGAYVARRATSQAPNLPRERVQACLNKAGTVASNLKERIVSSLKKSIVERGLELMGDPRVQKIVSDERVMRTVMQAMSVPGKVSEFTSDQVEKIAKAMSLATEDEVNDLKRTVRRLEEEVARLERDGKR